MNATRVYAVLLLLYPRRFRDEYGADMQAAFAEMYEHRRRRALPFWSFVIVDACWSAARERADAARWLATSVVGLAITVAAAHTASDAFRYFYHPFFDGVVVPAWACGVGLGLVLGSSVALAQRTLLPATLRRPRSWALASAVALPVAVLFCGAVIERVAVGLNPVPGSDVSWLGVLLVGLDQARNWGGLITQFVAMTCSALAVRTAVLRPRLSARHAH